MAPNANAPSGDSGPADAHIPCSIEQSKYNPQQNNLQNGSALDAPVTVVNKEGQSLVDAEAEIVRLAALPTLTYEQGRKKAAKRLGVEPHRLDKLVEKRRGELQSGEERRGKSLTFPELGDWPDAVDGITLLDSITQTLLRYVIMSAESAHAIALWIVAAHAFDCFRIFPRLCITAPDKRCGKTTLLEFVAKLVPRPLFASHITIAAIFRIIESHKPTLLIDEGDSFIPGNEELRGILNSGHRYDGSVIRCVGDHHEPKRFSTWAPVAIALINRLPPTLEDRSITVRLRRRLASERVTQLSLSDADGLNTVAKMVRRWTTDNKDSLAHASPAIPNDLINRAADNWLPLFAVAQVAGGEWLEKVSNVALSLNREQRFAGDQSIGMLLLADIKSAFEDTPEEALFSSEIVANLRKREDRPWPEYLHDSPITMPQVAKLLRPFGIIPGTVRRGDLTAKGYYRKAMVDAFDRYLADEAVTTSQDSIVE
ncbi:MAG: DUF3631 domain-containing protein [Alphaproteobacteria bacterium]|nr:DUF3631 domain-containing protein [Alphaproteobacteria bacterium]